MISTPLFTGQNLILTPFNIEKDAQAVSNWSYDLTVARQFGRNPARPMNEASAKKVLEDHTRKPENTAFFAFGIRIKDKKKLVGILRLRYIAWNHGAGEIDVIFGNPEHRQQCGSEALAMGLVYAFEELNLHRLNTRAIGENEQDAISLFETAGFTLEIRQREALFNSGRFWDGLIFGLFRSEWLERQEAH
ncbi:MAG TPA: GNAT family protein [Anaerolineaceae bacterium]|nr:GNAT family protein [Anaerolineaceae bacterium]HPN51086.1 GNAT family protein [Anaerolineaceae bacterium]